MGFTADFQLLSPRLRQGGVLWLLSCIFNSGGVEFYSYHRGFFIESTSPEADWIFIALTIDSQSLSLYLRRGRFL